MQQRAPDINVSSWVIHPVACALVGIGAKCWMIARYGSPTPFWDQWDAEAAGLYPNFLSGTLHFSDLIAPHNEHRILVTRLWSLLLLDLGGYWDPILQMAANTLILGAVVALFIAAFRPILYHRSWLAFALFSMVIFSLPFGWGNTLSGFNSQWYVLSLFSLAGLFVIINAVAFTPRWWLAALLLILSYFTMAAGALTVAVGLAVGVVQFVAGRPIRPARIAGARYSRSHDSRDGAVHSRACTSRPVRGPLGRAISSGPVGSHKLAGAPRPATSPHQLVAGRFPKCPGTAGRHPRD